MCVACELLIISYMKKIIKYSLCCCLLFVTLMESSCTSQGVGMDLGQILGQDSLDNATDNGLSDDIDLNGDTVEIDDPSLDSGIVNSLDSNNSATDANQSSPEVMDSELYDTDPIGTFSLPVNPSKNDEDCTAEEEGNYTVMLVDSSSTDRRRKSENSRFAAVAQQPDHSPNTDDDTEVGVEQCQVSLEGDYVWKDVTKREELTDMQVVVTFENGDEAILLNQTKGRYVLPFEWLGENEEFIIFVESKEQQSIISENVIRGKVELGDTSYEFLSLE